MSALEQGHLEASSKGPFASLLHAAFTLYSKCHNMLDTFGLKILRQFRVGFKGVFYSGLPKNVEYPGTHLLVVFATRISFFELGWGSKTSFQGSLPLTSRPSSGPSSC